MGGPSISDVHPLGDPPAEDASVLADVGTIRALLVEAARAGEAVSYSALLLRLGLHFTRPKMRALCRTMDAIDRAGVAAGEPGLAVLVVRESDGLPGQGWWMSHASIEGHVGDWTGPAAQALVTTVQRRAFRFWRARA